MPGTDFPPPREAVVRMAPYSPPTGGRSGKLRLDFNENTTGCPVDVLETLQASMDAAGLSMYPEYETARQELAKFYGVSPEELLLTNGTDEAIQVLVNTYVDAGNQVVLLQPSYAMYRFYAELAGAAITEIGYRPQDLSFPFEELLERVGPSTRAILMANPNNPTGTALEIAALETLLQAAPCAAVLVDEAYFEFCGITALPLLSQYRNLFVSRTFSKAFGLAALRVGCLVAQAENVAFLRKSRSPYSVNALAAAAARAAVSNTEHVRRYAAEVLRAKERLCRALDGLGIAWYPSRANFVLLKLGPSARVIRDRLLERGVLVRDRSYELPGCIRVTVGTVEQVERFLSDLKDLL